MKRLTNFTCHSSKKQTNKTKQKKQTNKAKKQTKKKTCLLSYWAYVNLATGHKTYCIHIAACILWF